MQRKRRPRLHSSAQRTRAGCRRPGGRPSSAPDLPTHLSIPPPVTAAPRLVDQLEALTPAVPSLFHCRSLTVKGRVRFGGEVGIRGDVTLTNSESRRLVGFAWGGALQAGRGGGSVCGAAALAVPHGRPLNRCTAVLSPAALAGSVNAVTVRNRTFDSVEVDLAEES